jgi:hypothetical protein
VAAGRSPPPGGLSFPRDSPGHGLYLRWVAPSPAPPQDAARATSPPGGGGRLAEASQVLTTSASAGYTPGWSPDFSGPRGIFRPYPSILVHFCPYSQHFWPILCACLAHGPAPRSRGLAKPRPRRYTVMLQHLSCPSGIFPALVCIFLHFSAPFLHFFCPLSHLALPIPSPRRQGL